MVSGMREACSKSGGTYKFARELALSQKIGALQVFERILLDGLP